MSELPLCNSVTEIAALRLVCVETSGEGIDLVSLTHRAILATGDHLGVDRSIPCITVGPAEEREASELAGQEYDQGHPGWPVLLDWLDLMFPAGRTPEVYQTSFCNHGHATRDGVPVGHECYVIPPILLRLEMAGHPLAADRWHRWAASPRKPHKGRPEGPAA